MVETDGWRKMLTLDRRLMYIYTWASIDATRAFSRQALKCCLLSYTLLLAIRGRFLCVVWRARHSFSFTCRVKSGQINYAALYRWRIVSLLSRYSSPYINLSPFFVTLDPNESMPAPSRRNVLLRHHADPCLPFNVGHLYMGLYRY